MNKKNLKFLIVVLIVVLIAIDYPIINKALTNWLIDYEVGIVERVIDGDTVVVNGTSVRLLGINTPEKKEIYYSEAKELLENLTLNKLVKMKKGKQDLDLYKRKLRYIIIDGENVNRKIVEKGYANYYFPEGKDQYYNDFKEAWNKCVEKNENLCEKSMDECSKCISLGEFNIKEQKIIVKNSCDFNCNLLEWTIKDEGRKKYTFGNFDLDREVTIRIGEGVNNESVLFWSGEDYIWTKTGDSLILRDDKGKLVLFNSY